MIADSDIFISEFKHWRDVRGLSQMALAEKMAYTRSYLSKIEGGRERPSADFAARADEVLQAGGALRRAFQEVERARNHAGLAARDASVAAPDVADVIGPGLLVEHDDAHLAYDGSTYTAMQRRKLRNVGTEPVTRYLIRISVDRFPGSPERSNQLYREDPLTWDELDLRAWTADDEPLIWSVHHDRDAFKELWLLFENPHRRFPLYPGESTWINYRYRVSDRKWGNWFQRAVRVPTRCLSVRLTFPTDLEPVVWGLETSTAAQPLPLRTAVYQERNGDSVSFSWSTTDPPLHARYRLEWEFRSASSPEEQSGRAVKPSQVMASLGIVQRGDPSLGEPARSFALPEDAEEARRVVAQLQAVAERVTRAHTFVKGVGLAAPQIGIDRAAAIVRPPAGEPIVLLNPRIVDESTEVTRLYEGCLSFFDVRGIVPRSLAIEVEHEALDGSKRITHYERGIARLVAHEIDHLNGTLYGDRMEPGVEPIPIEKYRGTGQAWTYP